MFMYLYVVPFCSIPFKNRFPIILLMATLFIHRCPSRKCIKVINFTVFAR
uniref:Uncharacterized protein n=1 Tax=Arundo donax TaxID=35708 RepID=A0A0A9FKF4_ARUDO